MTHRPLSQKATEDQPGLTAALIHQFLAVDSVPLAEIKSPIG